MSNVSTPSRPAATAAKTPSPTPVAASPIENEAHQSHTTTDAPQDESTFFVRAFAHWEGACALLDALTEQLCEGLGAELAFAASSLGEHARKGLSAVSEDDDLAGMNGTPFDMHNAAAVMSGAVQHLEDPEENMRARGILMLMRKAVEDIEQACSLASAKVAA